MCKKKKGTGRSLNLLDISDSPSADMDNGSLWLTNTTSLQGLSFLPKKEENFNNQLHPAFLFQELNKNVYNIRSYAVLGMNIKGWIRTPNVLIHQRVTSMNLTTRFQQMLPIKMKLKRTEICTSLYISLL